MADEAQVDRAGRGRQCLRLELAAGLVQVELLAPEREPAAAAGEGHRLHADAIIRSLKLFQPGLCGLPELEWAFGYPVTVAVMAIVDAYLFYKLRKPSWRQPEAEEVTPS